MFFLGHDSWSKDDIKRLNDDDVLQYLGAYHPWHGGQNPEFDDFSRRILDVKDRKAIGINKFVNYFLETLRVMDGVVICAVPSHDPQKVESGVHLVINEVCSKSGAVNGGHILVRNQKVDKSATGGPRDMDTHLNSIGVADQNLIYRKNILLLDDVTTSGSSIKACKQILLSNGANAVKCLPFSQTS